MIRIAVARIDEHEALAQCYRAWGYDAGIAPADRVYVARLDDRPIGIVRRSEEQGTLMLRGMQVDPAFHRRRVGTRLLRAFVAELPVRDCHCVPYNHLTHFYGQEGFALVDEADGPPHLRERLVRYRAEGLSVVLMRRPADRTRS